MASRVNVQEIVRCNPLQVPEKFLVSRREEDEPKSTADAFDLSSRIPIIDLSLLSRGHKEELNKLDQACKEWGFFQVVNHGVATEVLQGMKDATVKFFELPLEEKNNIRFPPGGMTATVKSKEIIEEYSSEVKRVGEELIESLSTIMGMEKDTLLGLHKELFQTLRVNYIPPCCRPEKVLGIRPHSDVTTITVLMQEDSVIGLQIRKDGQWVPVKPIPSAFVVNVGDVIEIWSNGQYKSVEHRAVPNESKARISYASFIFPHFDDEIEPIDHLVESSRMYKKVKYGDYLVKAMTEDFIGKEHTGMAKIGS
ncbi:unnamed protein product [Malus baccata var. baccata]